MALKLAPRLPWMLGMAMLTIVTSTRSMKAAVITMASANQRRRSPGCSARGAAADIGDASEVPDGGAEVMVETVVPM
ncbi:hypothetical protein GCM10018987_30530 [Streptomyces cremeus]